MASGPITTWQIDGETVETVTDFVLGGSKVTADGGFSHEIKRRLLLGRKVMTSVLKSRGITLSTKVRLVKPQVFPVVMYGCESWTIKKAEHWTVDTFGLWHWKRLFESPLDSKEIQPVHPKGNQSWILIGRTDAEAETPILWPLDVKNSLIWKDPDAGKDWRQEEKGTTEDEMVGWHHQLLDMSLSNLRELVMDKEAFSPWGSKESDTTAQLNWTTCYHSPLYARYLVNSHLHYCSNLSSAHLPIIYQHSSQNDLVKA